MSKNDFHNAANINTVTAGIQTDFDQAFAPITSSKDLDAEIAKGTSFHGLLEASTSLGHAATYHAIASAVHVATACKNNPALKKHLEDRAKFLNIEYEGGNAYGLVSRVMFGELTTIPGAAGSTSQKWVYNRTLVNKDRHIRYFVDANVPADKVVEQIIAAKYTVGNDEVTKLDAIAAMDLANNPLTAQQLAARTWGSTTAQAAITAKPALATVKVPDVKFNSNGFVLLVGRKAANGDVEIIYDAKLEDKTIQMGVRKGNAA